MIDRVIFYSAKHPASTTYSKLTDEERANVGITPGMVCIAVGLEAVEDEYRGCGAGVGMISYQSLYSSS